MTLYNAVAIVSRRIKFMSSLFEIYLNVDFVNMCFEVFIYPETGISADW